MVNTFTGVVVSSTSGSGTVTVARNSWAADTVGAVANIQGILVSSLFSAYLGFNQVSLPQPGTSVLCLEYTADMCYILGMIPSESVGLDSIPARTILGAKNALADGANRVGFENNTTSLYANSQPADVVDGEHVVSNEFGVLLGLYQQMANLKASELAQIQCFLLDDFVRVISHNFQHYTALGEYNVWHDGKRLMAEFGATHKINEAYGRPAVNADFSQGTFKLTGTHTVDDKEDFYEIKDNEQLKAIERFKLFLGSVADFIHLFVVRPDPDEIRTLDPSAKPKNPDTGLANVHVGTDGGVHVRSIKEVFIEKTNWIRVPLRKAAPDDPKGDDAESLGYDKKEKFEFKDDYTYKENPFTYALQIRDYVAYVNETLGYKNFKKHKEDFYVNDDINLEKNLKNVEKIDNETDLHLADYELRTAGIYLMPNGGITIRDAWNSAIVMEGGNIYLQPAKDLLSQPLRHNIVKAGGHINMAAKKDIDLSSSEEGVRIKAEKAQYIYSNTSGVVIEANGESNSSGPGADSTDAVEYIGGVVLKSKLSIYNYAENDVVNYAKGRILLQSLQNTDIIANTSLTLYGKTQLFSFSDASIVSLAGSLNASLADGSVIVAGSGSTVLGQKDQQLGVMYDKDSMFIDILYGVLDVPTLSSEFGKAKEFKQKILDQTVFGEEATFDALKFRYLSSQKYGEMEAEKDAIPATLAQQDDLLTNMYKLQEWVEKEINDTLPFPGKDLFENFYYSTEKPVNLEENKMGADFSNKADAGTKPCEIKLESLNKYKIQW